MRPIEDLIRQNKTKKRRSEESSFTTTEGRFFYMGLRRFYIMDEKIPNDDSPRGNKLFMTPG